MVSCYNIMVRGQNMNQEKEKTMRQILEKIGPLLRGSLSVAHKKCGKNCSTCREKGGHPATYFGYRKGGQTLVVHLPSSGVELAKKYHAKYKRLEKLVEAITEDTLSKIKGK